MRDSTHQVNPKKITYAAYFQVRGEFVATRILLQHYEHGIKYFNISSFYFIIIMIIIYYNLFYPFCPLAIHGWNMRNRFVSCGSLTSWERERGRPLKCLIFVAYFQLSPKMAECAISLVSFFGGQKFERSILLPFGLKTKKYVYLFIKYIIN